MADRIRVVIHDSRIQGMGMPGGDVWKFTRRLARETESVARGNCPFGGPTAGYPPGTLFRAHYVSVTPLPHGCLGYVGNHAPHALWVHEGTRTPITPTTSKWLKIPWGRGHVFRRAVRGQRSQPWLSNALHVVMGAHRL
jgi:hypothetical protein